MRWDDHIFAVPALVAVFLSACSHGGKAQPYTLYRNSPFDHASRVHFATFDVKEDRGDYNQRNCEMAARVLNANVIRSAEAVKQKPDLKAGFWCEAGPFSKKGVVPKQFPSAFPTHV